MVEPNNVIRDKDGDLIGVRCNKEEGFIYTIEYITDLYKLSKFKVLTLGKNPAIFLPKDDSYYDNFLQNSFVRHMREKSLRDIRHEVSIYDDDGCLVEGYYVRIKDIVTKFKEWFVLADEIQKTENVNHPRGKEVGAKLMEIDIGACFRTKDGKIYYFYHGIVDGPELPSEV